MGTRLQKTKIAAAATLGWPSWLKLPLVGDVDNKFAAPEAKVKDPRFGESEGVPFVMEIVVDGENSAPADVGKKVDSVFFQGLPKLLFNVSFACGKPQGLFRTGSYGDPRSHWFNVFFGYYEIDVEKAAWGRPFGYTSDAATEIAWDDILRIGKSDWNYFSNWVYGVPDGAIDPTNQPLRGPTTTTTYLGRELVNGKAWDVLEMDNVEMVSAYDDGGHGGLQLVDRELWSFLWRMSYGFPIKKKVVEQPRFFAVPMKGRFYMYTREKKRDNDLEKPSFQTFLFGGTINKWYSAKSPQHARDNEDFLNVQLEAVQRVLRTSYPDLGYDP